MDAWLSRARDTLASASGIDRSRLEISGEAAATLLDLARIAAHNSGDRTNAPLLCYLIGRAESGASLDDLDDALRGQI